MMLSNQQTVPPIAAVSFLSRLLIILISFTTLSSLGYAKPISLDKQHELDLYRETLVAIRKGDTRKTNHGFKQLKNHPLYPYLEKAQLYKRIRYTNKHTVDDFLLRHSDTVAGKQFRRKWLKHLAKQKRWQDFVHYYPSKQSNRELSCKYVEALFQLGHHQASLMKTTDLWLSDQSMPSSCDKAFKRWQASSLKNDSVLWQRLKLALDNKKIRLAKYLASTSSDSLKPYSKRLINIYLHPQQLPSSIDLRDKTEAAPRYEKDIAMTGLSKLMKKDAQLANQLWQRYRQQLSFDDIEKSVIRQQLGRQFIASGQQSTLPWLIKNDPNGDDLFLLEWRILLAAKNKQWHNATRWIKLLPDDDQQKPRWQYWLARSQQQQGMHQQALNRFKKIAKLRHYYGFMAAKQAQLPFKIKPLDKPSDINSQPLMATPAIQRAKAFYQLGELIPARREWYAATHHLDGEQLIAAGSIAHDWDWHQQAILATAKGNYKDDLTLRFPLAYQNSILPAAKTVSIKAEWIYAITRQESAFAADALSSAGAKGLMQLKTRTAKEVAKEAGINFKRSDLYKAEKNILLGSHYLQQLLETFKGNRILATAAFNAGPYRVKSWLKKQPQELDYDIWIDTLPYYETRNYIKNVLSSSVIYSYRLGYRTSLVDKHEQQIAFNKDFIKE